MILALIAVGFRCAEKPELYESTYRIEKGDTLWSLATRYAPGTMDLREWMWKVQKLNNLPDNEYLMPGAEIRILKEVKRSGE